MKSFLALTATSALLLSAAPAFAGNGPTQNQLLTQCKTLAKAQIENVSKVKLTQMKNRRGTFTAKFNVKGADENGRFLCTIAKGQSPELVRLDKVQDSVAAE